MNINSNTAKSIPGNILEEVRDKFHNVDSDPVMGKRLFFENSGGSLRLKSVVEAEARLAVFPDCSLREHKTAKMLAGVKSQAVADLRALFNARDGAIFVTYTASIVMFEMVKTVVENIPGQNIVTTSLEHPSAFDACEYYAKKTGKELRVAYPNIVTGAVEVNEIEKLVDKNTALLSVMAASNITGTNMNIEEIVKAARSIKPDIYIIVDCVQFAPHGLIDLEKTPVDGISIAPYKFFGNRGVAFSYLSDRLSTLPHHNLLAKDSDDWELGSPVPGDYAAISEVIDYICWLGKSCGLTNGNNKRAHIESGMKVIKQHEQALLERLLAGTEEIQGLRDLQGVTAHFDSEDLSTRSLILALTFNNIDCPKATQMYGDKGFIVYERMAFNPYSKRILDSFGLPGVIRVSPLHCYSLGDMDSFLIATKEIVENAGYSAKDNGGIINQ